MAPIGITNPFPHLLNFIIFYHHEDFNPRKVILILSTFYGLLFYSHFSIQTYYVNILKTVLDA